MPLRNLAKYLGGLALAVALLAWVLRGTDPRAVGNHLREVPTWSLVGGLILAAVLNLGQNVFRVWRWRALLEPVRRGIPFRPMFDAVILGYMTTWLVPGRLGELVRPALLSGREGVPLGPCLGSVFADRVLDGLAVLVLFAGGVAFTPLAGDAAAHATTIRNTSFAFVLLIMIPLVLLLVAGRFRARLERLLEGRRGALAWLSRFTLAFAVGTEALRRPRLLARSLIQTALAWLTIAAATWVGLRATGAEIPLGGVFVLLPLLVLGIALPTPGGAGGYHLAMKFGLMNLFGVAEPAAVAAGFLMHLVIVVPVIVLGVVLLLVDRIPLRELIDAAKQVRTLGHADSSVGTPLSDGEIAVKCPFCGHLKDKVVDSRETGPGDAIRRRRECLECGRRFTSYERIEEIPYLVVKKDGRREAFDRAKLMAGLHRACEKRPVSAMALARLVDEMEQLVQDSADREVEARVIGEKVMERLKELDKVAYVRFASVYRQFEDAQEFMAELRDLLETRK